MGKIKKKKRKALRPSSSSVPKPDSAFPPTSKLGRVLLQARSARSSLRGSPANLGDAIQASGSPSNPDLLGFRCFTRFQGHFCSLYSIYSWICSFSGRIGSSGVTSVTFSGGSSSFSIGLCSWYNCDSSGYCRKRASGFIFTLCFYGCSSPTIISFSASGSFSSFRPFFSGSASHSSPSASYPSPRVQEAEDALTVLQNRVLSGPSRALARDEHAARESWQKLKTAEEKFFYQRSRVRWMHLGDRNTSFFHKTGNAVNHIHFLRDSSDRKLADPAELKSHAVSYFLSIFGQSSSFSGGTVSDLQSLLPFRCSSKQSATLVKPVTDKEVRSTLFAFLSSKSPGPDGYPVEFFRASWNTVGKDVIAAVREFFVNGKLLKELNSTIIAFIPKRPSACKLEDYRPISCCNLIYKVISKRIANRLKPILPVCLSSNQTAFLKGRGLGENVLLASELVRKYQ